MFIRTGNIITGGKIVSIRKLIIARKTSVASKAIIGLLLCSLWPGLVLATNYEDGVAAYDAGDYKKAFKIMLEEAKGGNASAQWNLYIFYFDGQGAAVNKKQALYWLKRAAKHNHAKAQYQMGYLYGVGSTPMGIKKDPKTAIFWMSKAAENNDTEAQVQLGDLYRTGSTSMGVKPDRKRAYKYYKKAAENGDPTAQFYRAELSADPLESYIWYGVAGQTLPKPDPGKIDNPLAAMGMAFLPSPTNARIEMSSLKKKLSVEQRKAADRKIQEWIKYFKNQHGD
jgi:hypothetical protein